jgi:hypothetical protein
MRAPLLAIASIAALSGACAAVKPLTQVDRDQATRAVAEKPNGTVLTEGEISKLDLDSTFICETAAQVGSHIPRYQCRSLRRVERERASARGFMFDPEGTVKGCIPAELPPATISVKEQMASQKVVKSERPAQEQDAADQDPRFPPL